MKVYESNTDSPMQPGDTDGMEEMLGDDILPTDYDSADGPTPPTVFWLGTHDRHGKRIQGVTEQQYIDGE